MEGQFVWNRFLAWTEKAAAKLGGFCQSAHTAAHYLNPLNWSQRTIHIVAVAFFAIFLPIYIYISLQPAPSAIAKDWPKLKIPTIGLTTPVEATTLKGRELEVPATIAASYSQATNKTFLFGHSSTVFKNLDQVKIADYLTYDGKVYQVTARETLLKSDIDMREILGSSEQDTIIIMTCAGDPLPNQDATHRLILTAEFVQLEPLN